jgi:hypothetical protein
MARLCPHAAPQPRASSTACGQEENGQQPDTRCTASDRKVKRISYR